jgi:predicted glycosyltransferase
MYDYEFVYTRIFNTLSTRVMLPDAFSDDVLRALGLPGDRVIRYPGLKEEVYLGEFSPDPSILDQLGVNGDQIVVTIRPPATAAHYHNPLSEKIVRALIDRVSDANDVVGLVLPRTIEQGNTVRETLKNPSNFRILKRAVDGLNLIAHSDLVVGGGGTMNREAAMLGVPVFSVFTGKVGAVDRALSDEGKLVLVRALEDVDRVQFKKRQRPDYHIEEERRRQRSRELVAFLTAEVLRVAES